MEVQIRKNGRVPIVLALAIFSFLISSLAYTPHPPIAHADSSSIIIAEDSIDWPVFWKLFKQVAVWDLEYYSGSWVSRKDLLEIIREYPEPNHCKVTLNFTSDEAGSYRLTFAINKKVLSYVDKSSTYAYVLTYREWAVEFDWSDVIGISGLSLSHGIYENHFWFRIRRDSVPANFNVEIDPSIVADISSYDSYGRGFQRKSFYADGRFWQFYGNSSVNVYYKSSTDGENWNDATLFREGTIACFSLWFNGTHVHTVWGNTTAGGYIIYRRGNPNGDGTISWDPEQNVYNEAGWFTWEPTIAVNNTGHPFILYHFETDTTYCIQVAHSTTNNGTWTMASGYPQNLTIHDDEVAGVILPLSTNGNMYAIWDKVDNQTHMHGTLYDGDWSQPTDQIPIHCYYYETFSAVSRNDEIHLIATNHTSSPGPYLYVEYINYTSGSWGTMETIHTDWWGTGAEVHAVAIEDATDYFVVYIVDECHNTYDTWYYMGTAGDWGTKTVIEWSGGQNEYGDQFTSFRKNWGGYHSCTVLTTGSIKVEFWYLSGHEPTIGEFQAPSTVYAYQQVTLNCTVVDVDGNTTLKNASLTLSADSVVLTWVNSTNTFSMTDPNNKWQLVGGSRTSVNSTAYKLTWTVKTYWNSTEGYVSISSALVYDGDDNSGSNSEGNWFYNENDLIINSASVDDSQVNPSDALEFDGQIYYQGTSTAPYTTSGVTAKIELSSVEKGSNTSIASDGSFTIGFNAESSLTQHSYNVYSLTSKVSVQNQTVNVIVDRVNVTIAANTTTPYVSETVSFTVTGVYNYDGTTVTSWTVNINRNSTHFATGNFTDSQASEIIYSYTTENVTENTYGLSTFNSNTETVTWLGKWDVNLQARDYEGNILTEATIYMDNGTEHSQSVDSQGWANWTSITASTVDVHATWKGYTVNSTFTVILDSDQTVNVTCNAYPFTLDGTRYWIAGNATVSSYSWNSTTEKFVLSFSESVDTYTLKSSATSKPTYVLNCSYDLDNDWTTLLALTHYANRTLTIAYPGWASTLIYRADHVITDTYWGGDEILYVTLNGTSGQNGTLEVYCGGRGNPTSTSGLSSPVYFSGTTILAGTYTFSSTTTTSIDWTTGGGGGGGGGGQPSIFATAENIDVGAVQQGTSKQFNASATWTGATSITLTDVEFTGEGGEWLKVEYSFPQTIQRLAIETKGYINVPITISVPSNAKLGDYKVLVEYTITVGTRSYETTANILWTVTATPIAPGGIPELVSALLLIGLVGVVFVAVMKKR